MFLKYAYNCISLFFDNIFFYWRQDVQMLVFVVFIFRNDF